MDRLPVNRCALAGAFLVMLAGTALAQGPARLDCAKAATPIERAICAKPELAAIDRKMSAAYATLAGKLSGATRDQSATQAASNQPAVRQIPLKDPVPVSDPATLASVNASAPRLGTPSREDIVSAYHTALQSQAPAARIGNEAAAPSKTLDAETLAALMTRAKSLLALGDIAAARLLLERAANAQDATAAFLLAQTYDPAVLGVRDTRSITPDPVMARDWYRKAVSFGSADAQQRLIQLQD